MKTRQRLPVTAKSPQPPFDKGGQGGILISRITNRLLRIYTVLTLTLYGGCAVGPDHRPPELSVPSHWSEPLAGGSTHRSESLAQWWQAFRDKQLNALMAKAMESNLDLRIAKARVRETRALRGVVSTQLWPTVDGSATYTRLRTSENGPSGQAVTRGLLPLETNLYDVALDATWELDIFGGTRRAVEAAEAEIGAAQEIGRDVRVTLLAELGLNYIELRGLQKELAVTRNNLKAQQQTLELTRDRLKAGLATELDVTRARAQVATTASQIPALETGIKRAIHRLSVLMGNSPGALASQLLDAEPIPSVPPEVPVGLPSDLLRRRPDVRRAEHQLAAATAHIGVAIADLFPRFFLTGAIGLQSVSAGDLLTGGSQFWSLGPTIQWPIFNAGRIRQNIEVQNARQEQALLAYEQAVLISLEDVENALIAYGKEQARFRELSEAAQANHRAVELANDRYRSGLVDFLDVLEAERSLFTIQAQFTQSEQAVSQNLVRLYKALGGGWDPAKASYAGRGR
jgi:outer membrane protein, multidrug efflux system